MFSKSLTTLTTASIAALTLATNTQAAELGIVRFIDPFEQNQSAGNDSGQSTFFSTELLDPFTLMSQGG